MGRLRHAAQRRKSGAFRRLGAAADVVALGIATRLVPALDSGTMEWYKG
jgi:hypothetical protein